MRENKNRVPWARDMPWPLGYYKLDEKFREWVTS